MTIEKLMLKNLVECSPRDSVRKAAALMSDKNVGSVLVQNNGKVEGILTDRDIVVRCIAKGNNAEDQSVREVMTPSPETVPHDLGLFQVLQHMRTRKVRRMPVVDRQGKAVGIVAMDDLVSLLSKELSELSGVIQPDSKIAVQKKAS